MDPTRYTTGVSASQTHKGTELQLLCEGQGGEEGMAWCEYTATHYLSSFANMLFDSSSVSGRILEHTTPTVQTLSGVPVRGFWGLLHR